MKRLFAICVVLTLISSCVSAERRAELDAAVAQCKSSGGTAYVDKLLSRLALCASPEEQDRFERLEIACLQGGGEVSRWLGTGVYRGCIQPKTEIIVVNEAPSGRKCVFKMACKD